MIDALHGTVTDASEGSVRLMTASGVGFVVATPSTHVVQVGASISLHTFLSWHQEQGPQLFGFENKHQRALFELLISCSGIGPKLALSMLSQVSPNVLIGYIERQDLDGMSSLNGIGKKKAEQILVALKHKVNNFVLDHGSGSESAIDTRQLTQVLQSLSYSKQEIQAAVQAVHERAGGASPTFDDQMRIALAYISQSKQLNRTF